MRGASRIFAIDVNSDKFTIATSLGATDCINPKSLPEGTTIQTHIVNLTKYVMRRVILTVRELCGAA
jgi:S-(hydroxymethyl)glutathione dehydrogenase/alcohol dehydrogenase